MFVEIVHNTNLFDIPDKYSFRLIVFSSNKTHTTDTKTKSTKNETAKNTTNHKKKIKCTNEYFWYVQNKNLYKNYKQGISIQNYTLYTKASRKALVYRVTAQGVLKADETHTLA